MEACKATRWGLEDFSQVKRPLSEMILKNCFPFRPLKAKSSVESHLGFGCPFNWCLVPGDAA